MADFARLGQAIAALALEEFAQGHAPDPVIVALWDADDQMYTWRLRCRESCRLCWAQDGAA